MEQDSALRERLVHITDGPTMGRTFLVMLGIVVLLVITETVGQITLTIAADLMTQNTKEVYFDARTFKELYHCMCNKTTQSCVADFDLINNQRNVAKIIQVQGMVSDNDEFSHFFRCLYSQNKLNVTCSKSKLTRTSRPSHLQSFSYTGDQSCELDCLTIIWRLPQEKFDFSSVGGNIQTRSTCSKGSSPQVTQSTTSAHLITTVGDSNCTKTQCGKEQSDGNDRTGVIVGVVVTLLLIAIVAVVIFLLWRRKKSRSQQTKRDRHLAGTTNSNPRSTGQVNKVRSFHYYEGKVEPSSTTTQRDCDVTTDDYAYVVDDNTPKHNSNNTPISSDTVPAKSAAINNTDNSDVLDDGYSSINSDSSHRPNVYSKLGDKAKKAAGVRNNPYNALLHPKEDPKLRPPMKITPQSELASQQPSRYSMAQPILNVSANPQARQEIEVITVGKDTPMDSTVSENVYNFVDNDYQTARRDSSTEVEKEIECETADNSKTSEPPYFDLENDEGIKYKDYSEANQTGGMYFELEKEKYVEEKDAEEKDAEEKDYVNEMGATYFELENQEDVEGKVHEA